MKFLSKPPQLKMNNIKMDHHQFIKENQRTNNSPQKNYAHNLSYYYQGLFDFFTKKPWEGFPKLLINEINKNLIEKIFLKTTRRKK